MYIHVKVLTRMKNESIEDKSKDHLVVSVKDRAERNIANNRVLELIADKYKTSRSQVRIVNGHHSPSKLIFVDIDS